jgi:putative ABC transport system substrate-binding protein
MRRREFVTALGGMMCTWPLAAHAQRLDPRRVGVLIGTEDVESLAEIAAFTQRLQELGWVEGRNVHIDVRSISEESERDRYAAELVMSAPDVIVVSGNPAVEALKAATRTIPIVFALVGDPVGSGFVASLAKPGGNITGFMHFEPATGGKWLEVLTEIAPVMKRATVLMIESTANVQYLRAAQAAGATLGVAVSAANVRGVAEVERALSELATEPNGGIVLVPNPVNRDHRETIAQALLRHQLPSVSAFRYMAAAGGSPPMESIPSASTSRPPPTLIASCAASVPASFPCRRQHDLSW